MHQHALFSLAQSQIEYFLKSETNTVSTTPIAEHKNMGWNV